MKPGPRRTDFVLSAEVLAAASALGKHSDVAASKAMRGATRRLIREQQYQAAMQQKARAADETTSGNGATPKIERSAPYANEETKMNVREFIGGTFLKPEDIGPTPIVLTIINVAEGRYDKLDLTFGDDSKMSLNSTNGRTIAKAWGFESDAWIGKQVELSVGLVAYKGEQQETILLKPISPATPANELALAKRQEPEIDEDIPF